MFTCLMVLLGFCYVVIYDCVLLVLDGKNLEF